MVEHLSEHTEGPGFCRQSPRKQQKKSPLCVTCITGYLNLIVYFLSLFIFNVHWCFACMHICVRVPDLGVTDRYELLCECWDLKEQPVLL